MDRRKFLKLIGGAAAAAVAAPALLAAQVATPAKATVPVLHPIKQPLYNAADVVTFETNRMERGRFCSDGTFLVGMVAGAAVRSAATERLMSGSFQSPVSRGARRAMLLGSSAHERQRSQATTSRGFPS